MLHVCLSYFISIITSWFQSLLQLCISSSTGVSYTRSIDWCFQTFIDTTAALQACASYDGCLNNWCPRNFPNNNPIMAAVKTNDNCSQTTPEKAKKSFANNFHFLTNDKNFWQPMSDVCLYVSNISEFDKW